MSMAGGRIAWAGVVWCSVYGGGVYGGGVARGAGNLVRDGGCEQSRTYPVPENKYMHHAVQAGWQLSGTADRVVVPAVLDQFCGRNGVLKVVHGSAPQDVRSGSGAVLIKGQFYLKAADGDAYKTREGDEYVVRYYAKGTGKTRVYMHVYGTGRVAAEDVSVRGQPQPNRWTLIEQRLRIVGAGAKGIAVRMWASAPMRIDDVEVRRWVPDAELIEPGRAVAPYELSKVTCAPRTKTAPTIDGRLDDPCWRAAPRAGGFLAYGRQDHLARPATFIRAVYDADYLYLGVECMEPDLSVLSMLDAYPDAKRDRWVGKSTIEVFLDRANNRIDYYQLAATARCHMYDSIKHDATWDGQWEVKPHVGTDRWSLEFRIAFKALGTGTPKPADTWGLNVCRDRRRIHSTWSPVGNQFHNPDLFGKLVFGTYQDWYQRVLLEKQKAVAHRVRTEAGQLGSRTVADRLARLESYQSELTADLDKTGFPKTWDGFMRLYAKGQFVVESIEDLDVQLQWLKAAAGVAGSKGDPR